MKQLQEIVVIFNQRISVSINLSTFCTEYLLKIYGYIYREVYYIDKRILKSMRKSSDLMRLSFMLTCERTNTLLSNKIY